MVPTAIVVTAFLIQITCGYNEDFYPLSDSDSYLYPEDLEDNDLEIRRRNSNFMRFGRSGKNSDFEDYNEDFARPTRSGKTEKTDHFIRFGRSRQDFLRFGRGQERPARSRGDVHLRFGRSAAEPKARSKRETSFPEMKRGGSNYMRFGRARNNNFMRFGRIEATPETTESPLIRLLAEIVENLKKEQKMV